MVTQGWKQTAAGALLLMVAMELTPPPAAAAVAQRSKGSAGGHGAPVRRQNLRSRGCHAGMTCVGSCCQTLQIHVCNTPVSCRLFGKKLQRFLQGAWCCLLEHIMIRLDNLLVLQRKRPSHKIRPLHPCAWRRLVSTAQHSTAHHAPAQNHTLLLPCFYMSSQ